MATSAIDHQPRQQQQRRKSSVCSSPEPLLALRAMQLEAQMENGSLPTTMMMTAAQQRQQDMSASTTTNSNNSKPETGSITSVPATPQLRRIPTYLQPNLPWRERLLHFTFAWYTVTMSTSGIALIIALTPHRFPGLSTIGLIIFLLDLLVFLLITVAILLRFILYSRTLRRAFTRPTEALFVPTFFLSIAAILSNVAEYGALYLNDETSARGGALSKFLAAAFWVYLGVTFIFSVFQYHLIFSVREERRLTVSAMTPAWILPIFPVMLAGTLAGAISKSQEPEDAVGILCAGLAAQGLGMFVSIFFYSTYLSRLMAFGLPAQRPGMFIAVGPPSFTCAALVAMASDMPRIMTSTAGEASVLAGLGDPATMGAGVRLLAINVAVFFWGLSFWFFASAAAAVVAGMPDSKFHLSWWSFVFPNVGFAIASMRLGEALGSEGVLWLSSVMTVGLFLAWGFIGFRCVRAVVKREIVWPGHDEDSD